MSFTTRWLVGFAVLFVLADRLSLVCANGAVPRSKASRSAR